MTPEPRIFRLRNSSNENVATWSLLGRESSFNKEDPVPRSNMDKFRTDQSHPDRLEFLYAFSCPLTLYHNCPSFKTLQSNSPCQHYLMPLCSPQPWTFVRTPKEGDRFERCILSPTGRLSIKYIALSFLKNQCHWLLCASGSRPLFGNNIRAIRSWKFI